MVGGDARFALPWVTNQARHQEPLRFSADFTICLAPIMGMIIMLGDKVGTTIMIWFTDDACMITAIS